MNAALMSRFGPQRYYGEDELLSLVASPKQSGEADIYRPTVDGAGLATLSGGDWQGYLVPSVGADARPQAWVDGAPGDSSSAVHQTEAPSRRQGSKGLGLNPTSLWQGFGSSASATPAIAGGSNVSTTTALGSLDGMTATSSGAVSGGGGAVGGSAGGASLAGLWPYAVAAAAIGNEWYSKSHGERREGADYYKDLATGRVLSQDVDNRWSPMLFGESDNTGLGHDMSFAADLGSFQVGKAFKDLGKSSLLTGFGLFK